MTTSAPLQGHDDLRVELAQAEQLWALRTSVLRPDFEPGRLAVYDVDALQTTLHVVARHEPTGQVVGCATIMLDPWPLEPERQALRLRGMAVEPAWRGRGVGQRVLGVAMTQAVLAHPELTTLWCNARLGAVHFYERMGFVRVGDLFELEAIGPHYRMWTPLVGLSLDEPQALG